MKEKLITLKRQMNVEDNQDIISVSFRFIRAEIDFLSCPGSTLGVQMLSPD